MTLSLAHWHRQVPEFTGRRVWVKPCLMQSSLLFAGEARIAELVRAYLAAEYRWEQGGEWLNLSIGDDAPELRQCYPDARHFGLLSAWDPYSIQRPQTVNRSADDALHAALEASDCSFRPAFSSAANRSWREPSWLVADMPVDRFDALSRSHGQLASLYWPAHCVVRMRVDARQPRADESHHAVDWLKD